MPCADVDPPLPQQRPPGAYDLGRLDSHGPQTELRDQRDADVVVDHDVAE
jgi:hypothetical protein